MLKGVAIGMTVVALVVVTSTAAHPVRFDVKL